jgi:hypothetical protein
MGVRREADATEQMTVVVLSAIVFFTESPSGKTTRLEF